MVQDIVQELKVKLEGELAKVGEVKLDLEAKIASLDSILVEVEAEKKIAFDKGFEDGLSQSGMAGTADKIFSDAEMNAELAPLKEQIATLEGEKSALTDKVMALEMDLAGVPAKIDEALVGFKAELKAQYEAQQVAETQGEVGFAALLG